MAIPLRVLTVTDRPEDVERVKSELCRAGFTATVIHVANEPDYIGQLNASCNLILSDYQLTRFSAARALAVLQEQALDIPFIVLSDNASEDVVVDCMRQGVTDYVFNSQLARLGPAITRALEQRRLREQKRWADQALRRSEKRFRALIENSSDGIWLLNADGTLVYASASVTRILGYRADELIAADWFERVHPEERADVRHQFAQLLNRSGESMTTQFRYARQDSSWSCLECVATNLISEPSVQAVVLNYRDVTEARSSEQALRESERRYRDLFENANDIVYTHDLKGNLTSINRAAERATGYARAEALTMNISQVLAPEYVEPIRQILAPEALGKGPRLHELEIITKDGRRLPLELSTRLIFRDGQPVGVQGIARDISERKKIRRASEERERFANQMEELYQTILEINSQPDLSTLLPTIVQRAADLLGVRMGALYLMDGDGDSLELAVSHNLPGNFTGARLRMGEGLAGRVAQTGKPVCVSDYAQWSGQAELCRGTRIHRTLGIPLVHADRVIGVLNITDDQKTGEFVPDEIRLATMFADHAAIAIENARLLTETRARADEFATLYERTRDLATQHELDELLKTTIESAAKLLNAQAGSIYLHDSSRGELELVVVSNLALSVGTRLKMGEAMAGRVALSQSPMIVHDYSQWEHRYPLYEGLPIGAVVEVPMLFGGELIGVLGVNMQVADRKFTDADARLLSLFAMQAASAVHNARLFQETRLRAEQLALLYDAGLALNRVLDPQVVMQFLLKAAGKSVHADRCDFFRYDAALEQLTFENGSGFGEIAWDQLRKIKFKVGDERGLVGHVAAERIPLYLPDVTADPRWIPIDSSIRTGLWTPVEREGELRGVLSVTSTRPDAFRPADQRLVALYANQLSVALENARLYKETRRRAEQLAALNAAAFRIRADLSADEILRTTCDELRALGVFASVFTVHGECIHHKHTSMSARRAREFARLFGSSPFQVSIPTRAVEPLLRRLRAGETFVESGMLAGALELIPPETAQAAEWVRKEAVADALLLAPLTDKAELTGILVVVGENVDRVDVPAVALFARHVSTALEAHKTRQVSRVEPRQLS